MTKEEKKRDNYLGLVARVMAYEIYGLKHECEECGYQGRVEVHHVNKDRTDNRRENLSILCRKCHNIKHGVIKFREFPKMEVILNHSLLKGERNKIKRIEQKRRRERMTELYRQKWLVGEDS